MWFVGLGPTAAGLGYHRGMERELEYLEGWPVWYTADREHGDCCTGHV